MRLSLLLSFLMVHCTSINATNKPFNGPFSSTLNEERENPLEEANRDAIYNLKNNNGKGGGNPSTKPRTLTASQGMGAPQRQPQGPVVPKETDLQRQQREMNERIAQSQTKQYIPTGPNQHSGTDALRDPTVNFDQLPKREQHNQPKEYQSRTDKLKEKASQAHQKVSPWVKNIKDKFSSKKSQSSQPQAHGNQTASPNHPPQGSQHPVAPKNPLNLNQLVDKIILTENTIYSFYRKHSNNVKFQEDRLGGDDIRKNTYGQYDLQVLNNMNNNYQNLLTNLKDLYPQAPKEKKQEILNQLGTTIERIKNLINTHTTPAIHDPKNTSGRLSGVTDGQGRGDEINQRRNTINNSSQKFIRKGQPG